MFGTTSPPRKFNDDATGGEPPHGQTVKNPRPAGFTAVNVATTALALAGNAARAPIGSAYCV